MEEITPIDVLHKQFKRGIRGYSCSEVEEFLRQVAEAMETCVKERADLRDRLEQISVEVDRCREIESTMNNALVLAQKTADELKANAHHEAELIVREAEQASAQQTSAAREELAEVKAQLRMLQEEKDKFESEFRGLLRSCSEWLDKQSSNGGASSEAES